MNIEQLKDRALTNSISSINKASDPLFVQQVLMSVAYSTFHGNTDPLNKIDVANWNPLQRKWLFDNVVKTCTSKNKTTNKYDNNSDKRLTYLTPIYSDMAGVTWENVVDSLPFWKPEVEKKVVKFDAVKSAKNLLVRANKSIESGEFEGDLASVQALVDALKPFNV